MPKKAVATFFLLAFIGAALFTCFTFPRTKDQLPKSNNIVLPQPLSPQGPGSAPAPENVPHPNAPHAPPGPTLRVMAWASAAEARALTKQTDAFVAVTGHQVSLTVDSDAVSYRKDVQQALTSNTPPDVCLVAARDFSGLEPRELIAVHPNGGAAQRAVSAFTIGDEIKAVPAEFSVEVLYYNPTYFDQAGIGYPSEQWTWDMLQADARAIGSLKLTDSAGRGVYPLEMSADFDLWNILCTQAGHPALDLGEWHLKGNETQLSQVHALDLIRDLFSESQVTTPPGKPTDPPGRFFSTGHAALLIAPSDVAALLPRTLPFAITSLPRDLASASLARVNGWAVTVRSTQAEAALDLAQYLADEPVHAGWSSVRVPANAADKVVYVALDHAVVPRIEPKTARLADYLDAQINGLARDPLAKSDVLYAKIQTHYEDATGVSLHPVSSGPAPKANTGGASLRGL